MFRRLFASFIVAATAAAGAAAPAPDAFVLQLSNEVIDAVKADKAIQSGDVGRIRTLVDAKVMPSVNLQRMVRKSVGPQWNGANPEQQKRLSDEFKTYLINTYSGALTQVKDQSVRVRPLRGAADADEVVVGTDIVAKAGGEPIKLDYRLEKAGDAWKIYDFNVLGLWASDSFRSQFAKDLSAGGVDALIARLAEKNRGIAAPAKN
jgi:phospholipid transport system substrate-binding protein